MALTRSLDPTRPINDASGYVHVITDIFTVHDYTQSVDIFRERYAPTSPDNLDGTYVQHANLSIAYGGQPYMVDEYGGTFWLPSYSRQPPRGTGRNGWGYGKTAEEVETLIGALTKILLTHPNIAGYTYTQLTDVEQEVNGVYTYERELKFNTERMREIFGGPAAIEQP